MTLRTKNSEEGVMARAILIVFIAATGAFAETPSPKPAPTPEDLIRRVKATAFVERLERFSERFIGTPYEAGALGEGAGARFDQGPEFRFDAFDCTTLVETVIALALSRSAREFPTWLRKIRYQGGERTFHARNHLPCGDWTPNNTASGLLTDLTERLAGPLGTREASADETKKEWFAHFPKEVIRVPGLSEAERDRRYAELQSLASRFPGKHVAFKYIPLETLVTRKPVGDEEKKKRLLEEEALVGKQKQEVAVEIDPKKAEDERHKALVDLRLKHVLADAEVDARFLAEIPSGVLINIVRPNYSVPGTRILISHQGLVVRKGGQPYFRHVSRSGGGRTKDVLLANYLRLCLLSPPIKGIQVLRINDLRN